MEQKHSRLLLALFGEILKAELYIVHGLLMVFDEIPREVDLVAVLLLRPQVRQLGDIEGGHVEQGFGQILRFEL
jgi:hypothetical protein